MNLKKIVLTGGPCAGKTTALKSIQEYLESKNIPVITVPESATELILNGIVPNLVSVYNFQKLVIKKQVSKEEIAETYAKLFAKDKPMCVIIYDRGIMDNKAYVENQEEFDDLLKKFELNEIDVLDNYDLILNLLSTATCKPEAYNFENKARTEKIEASKELDKRTSNAWIHHRNIETLSSDIPLEDEIGIIIQIIDSYLNNNQIKKINKYLLDDNSDISIYNKTNSEKLNITNYTIHYDNNYNYVLTKREYKNNSSFLYRVYKEEDNFITILEDRKITKEKFNEILNKNSIKKEENFEEINFLYDNLKYKICIFENYKTLQIENLMDKPLQIPNNLSIIKEKKLMKLK